MEFNELKRLYDDNFALGTLGKDINMKFAAISLICYIVHSLQEKKPGVTYYQVIHKIADGVIPESEICKLAIICEDFGYGCKSFPTFNIQPKEMPAKVKEILTEWLPF